MLFNTYKFIFIFFPFIFFLCKKIPRAWLIPTVVAVSFLFYAAAGHVWFLVPMLFTTVFDYFAVIKMAELKNRAHQKSILLASLIINIGMLFYFKYSYFMIDSFWSVLQWSGSTSALNPVWLNSFKVILPAGISFYTFQTISYSIDVYRGQARAEKNFWNFAGFISFFPHLVAGPITRHNQLLPQLENMHQEGIKSRYEDGIYLFVLGLSKKVLMADQIAMIINPLIDGPLPTDILSSWLLLIGFTLQLYFDFSGYSDMAIGLARLFGIELPQNFNSPYTALNPSDFWKRWHISLSAWLRDYLYISLGGNKKRRSLNLFITMLLGGLWHGANWTFVIWGAYHGILLILYHRMSKPWDALHSTIQRLLTFICVIVGWLFFRSRNFDHLVSWGKQLGNIPSLVQFNLNADYTRLMILISVGLLIVNFLPIGSRYDFRNLSAKWQIVIAFMLVWSLTLMNTGTNFLYYQF